MTYSEYGYHRGQFEYQPPSVNHGSFPSQPQPTSYQMPPGNGYQSGAPVGWNPPPRRPLNPLLYEPLGFFERSIAEPQCRFVIVGDPYTIHSMITDTYRRLGFRIRFKGDRYKPRKTQTMTGEIGSAIISTLDPTPGMLHTHGVISTAWARRPNGYIAVNMLQLTGSIGAAEDMATGLFPRFCLGLYDLFVQHRMLVWVGEIGSRLYQNRNLAAWPPAPGSPTPRVPYEVTEEGVRAAMANGWRVGLV